MLLSSYYIPLCFFIDIATTSKILGVFPSTGYSQFILGEKLMGELARRGHEVTVISPFQPKKPIKNFRSILADSFLKNTEDMDQMELIDINVFISIFGFYLFASANAESILAEKEVQNLIYSNETFDLVIVEQFGNEAHMGFASHFKAPLISFSSLGLSEWNSDLVGNVRLPSITPMLVTSFSNRMNFWQRVQNTILYLFDSGYRHCFYYPNQQKLLNEYFPEKFKLSDVMNKVDLLLMNSHVTTTEPSLLTSAVIEIGGFHVTSNKLPQDLKKYLDEAKHGVIYFSMGSNFDPTKIPKETVDTFLNVFLTLNQKVILKFGNENFDFQHENLYISKWLPQSDILAHPNVVAFITHSGLLSTTEAMYHGVPMICIPIFGDQKLNMKRVVEKNIGIELPYSEISEENLSRALKEILENPLYKENSERLSSIIKHQPIQPLELAMHWVEHIIQYKGGPHLRNASMDLNWFQLYLLDVVSFFIISLAVIICLIKFIVKSILCRRRNSNEKIKKN